MIIIGTYKDEANRRDVLEMEQRALQVYSDGSIYPEVGQYSSADSVLLL